MLSVFSDRFVDFYLLLIPTYQSVLLINKLGLVLKRKNILIHVINKISTMRFIQIKNKIKASRYNWPLLFSPRYYPLFPAHSAVSSVPRSSAGHLQAAFLSYLTLLYISVSPFDSVLAWKAHKVTRCRLVIDFCAGNVKCIWYRIMYVIFSRPFQFFTYVAYHNNQIRYVVYRAICLSRETLSLDHNYQITE